MPGSAIEIRRRIIELFYQEVTGFWYLREQSMSKDCKVEEWSPRWCCRVWKDRRGRPWELFFFAARLGDGMYTGKGVVWHDSGV